MTAKKLIVASALLLGTTSATLAQGYYVAPVSPGPYGYAPGYGTYDYAPGYIGTPYGYGLYDDAPGDNYQPRGGPGPRVGNGTGAGIGAVR